FFVGDAFAPSGIDDYCLLNRNLVSENSGYLLCLKKLRDIKEPFWIVNEHIQHVFAFTVKEMDYIERRYRERIAILEELFPWDDPNYGIDEQWAVCYPRTVSIADGETTTIEVRLLNHSPITRTFRVKPRLPNGARLTSSVEPVTLKSGGSGSASFTFKVQSGVGSHLVTADIESDGMHFQSWVDALVTVRE
ncbi:MAG: hypothetical protein ABGX07_19860, partial [Pirellulaceae bacterium]